jgi:hypothetical protein
MVAAHQWLPVAGCRFPPSRATPEHRSTSRGLQHLCGFHTRSSSLFNARRSIHLLHSPFSNGWTSWPSMIAAHQCVCRFHSPTPPPACYKAERPRPFLRFAAQFAASDPCCSPRPAPRHASLLEQRRRVPRRRSRAPPHTFVAGSPSPRIPRSSQHCPEHLHIKLEFRRFMRSSLTAILTARSRVPSPSSAQFAGRDCFQSKLLPPRGLRAQKEHCRLSSALEHPVVRQSAPRTEPAAISESCLSSSSPSVNSSDLEC